MKPTRWLTSFLLTVAVATPFVAASQDTTALRAMPQPGVAQPVTPATPAEAKPADAKPSAERAAPAEPPIAPPAGGDAAPQRRMMPRPDTAGAPVPRPSRPMPAAAELEAPPPDPIAPASRANLTVIRATLDNGLRVVMTPDKTVPTVATAIYYDVGSRNEVRGRSGFAHLFEHMMFQGSANVPKGGHFQLVMNRGGSVNGTTSHDRTNYFETLPSNDLALSLWLEADRLRSLAVNQENFENQRQTVMEERRQSYDNRPYMASMLKINELAYWDYFPYAHSTIGDMADLQAAPLSAVQEFFHAYYTPNNAVLSIAGDFEPDAAMALIRSYFGELVPRAVPPYQPPVLPPQTAERVDTIADPLAELPAFHIAYHIPENRHVDHYALELLAIVLGDGESSRLYQELVKKREILQEISVGTDDRRGPDLFSVWAICAQGKQATDARSVIYEQLKAIAKNGITPRELEKAKNRIRSSFVFGLQSNLSRAMQLAEFEMYYGDANLLLTEAERYLSVTLDDIKRVASTYFSETNRTVLDVMPASAPATAAPQANLQPSPQHAAPGEGAPAQSTVIVASNTGSHR